LIAVPSKNEDTAFEPDFRTPESRLIRSAYLNPIIDAAIEFFCKRRS
jgi:hypothetical protein